MTDNGGAGAWQVRKRDGNIDPFASGKVFESLRRVLVAANDIDPPATAEGLTHACLQYLGSGAFASPIPTGQIADLIEKVLSESGFVTAGGFYHQSTRQRDRLRRQLHVAHYRPSSARYVHRRWSKSAVVAALQTDHSLERLTARQLASSIEWTVLRSGVKVFTTGLIRELIVGELLSWGLTPAALRVVKGTRPSVAPARRGADSVE